MGLFDKKFCDICGKKIGLLGNRKLEDGNLCKECARKLSPWMTDRRQSTVEEIRQHLAYREENRSRLASFHPNAVLGGHTKVYIDTNAGLFAVTSKRDFPDANPDLIPLSQVMSCDPEVEEHRREIYRKDKDGNNVSYNPPRYECSYEFTMHIRVNSPYFSEIDFELSERRPESRFDGLYHDLERQADEIRRALMPGGYGGTTQPAYNYQQPIQTSGPKFCTSCGSTLDGGTKFCPNCGAQVQ